MALLHAFRCVPMVTAIAIGIFAASSMIPAAEWRQFRGADSSSVGTADLPTQWSPTENIAWKADLPGQGISGPIVVAGKVYVTASSGIKQDRLHVLAFDEKSGKLDWERQFWATGRTMCHNKMAVATPHPASDGERIFAFFSSNDLVCLDLQGNLLWFRGLTHDYPNASNSLGMSSSPVVIGDTVIVQVENDSESFAAGLDVQTGEQRWKIERPKLSNWTSPSVLNVPGTETSLVLLQSGQGLAACDPRTGKQIWNFGEGCNTIPSTGVAGNILLVPSSGLTALKFDGTSQTPQVLWKENKLAPASSSPVAHEGRVYTLNRAGVISCGELETGRSLWQLRLKGAFWSTPVIASGHIYCFNDEGVGFVVKPGDKEGTIVSENALGESLLASPAVADGALFVRTQGHLWKIAK